jgi:hypothetical protein
MRAKENRNRNVIWLLVQSLELLGVFKEARISSKGQAKIVKPLPHTVIYLQTKYSSGNPIPLISCIRYHQTPVILLLFGYVVFLHVLKRLFLANTQKKIPTACVFSKYSESMEQSQMHLSQFITFFCLLMEQILETQVAIRKSVQAP